MTLIRWNPAASRHSLAWHDDVNRMFNGYFTRLPFGADVPTFYAPAVDIEETQDDFVLRADLPGMSQKDVKVSLVGDTLTLRGERRRESEHTDHNLHHTERVYGTFERTFKLAGPVRSDRVSATYRDGVLEVHVPKAEEARLREIEVQVG